MNEIVLTASEEFIGERLDKFIADNAENISRSYAAKLCEDGNVKSNGVKLSKKYKIKGKEEIFISVPEPSEPEAVSENIPLDIVYEDDDVIIINKPQGMVVHPAAGNETGTLVNGLLYHCGSSLSAINGVVRPGIVHRIDKDTSGLLIAAKNNEAHLSLCEQWKSNKPLRKYITLVNGNIKEDKGTIDKPIARHPIDRKKMAVVIGGREAITHYKVIERYGQYSLVECTLETGRTHQIRVHMASIGHSVVGDKTYGIKKEKFNLNGQLLHAATLGFIHPSLKTKMEFTSELPDYFQNVLNKLRKI